MTAKFDENNWFGMMTIENTQLIADMIRRKLAGKIFTFITANEFFDFIPEVHQDQVLEPSVNGDPVNTFFGNGFSGFHVCDTYGVWGCTTNTDDNRYDPEYNNPYFSFNYREILIKHRAPAGHLLYWKISIQGDL